MPVTHIPQRELDEARRSAIRRAASRPPKTESREGGCYVEMSIPEKAYLNAVTVGGHTLDDTEYWRDMRRIYPEINVKYTPRKLSVAIAGNRFTPSSSSGKMTRFGRVSFSKRYS